MGSFPEKLTLISVIVIDGHRERTKRIGRMWLHSVLSRLDPDSAPFLGGSGLLDPATL